MLARELEIIKSATKRAGELALKMQNGSLLVEEKPDGQGPVSDADLAVNEFLKSEFARQLPEIPVLSEEDEDDLERLNAPRLIIMDPIDGTKAFIDGKADFSISVALVENNQPAIGVIAAPAHDHLYFAAKNNGAFCNETPLTMAPAPPLKDAKILASRARYNRSTLDAIESEHIAFRPSIALRLALVAQGEFDASIALRPSWDWDIAAGHCIIKEAGGDIFNRYGETLTYNQENPQQDGIVAARKDLLETITEISKRQSI